MNYKDSNGWTHLYPNPKLDQSENKIMFTALLNLFEKQEPFVNEVYAWHSSSFRRNANRSWDNGSFSHDEMTGLYCLLPSVKNLPISKWEYTLWLHPRDLSFYFYCHHKKLGLLVLWIASIAMIFSCCQTYKVRNGRKMLRTDGKLLTYLRCKKYNLKTTFWICDKIIKLKKDFGSWDCVFSIYFKDANHPLNRIRNK